MVVDSWFVVHILECSSLVVGWFVDLRIVVVAGTKERSRSDLE